MSSFRKDADGAVQTAIKLEGLELTLGSQAGQVNILKGIDFSVSAGETVSIVGPSGSGKTSMLMLIAGLERATAGSVSVIGNNLGNMSEDQLALLRCDHIGIVFQSFQLIPTMTALENVAVPLELAGRGDAFEAAADALARVGLDHRLEHYPEQLSGGEQQRVAIARAFVAKPRLLLADEPTGNLDGHTGEQIIELLFGLARDEGTTLMLITHDMDLAARCGRTVRVADGRVVEDSAQDAGRTDQAAE